jgi:hypothetical protein
MGVIKMNKALEAVKEASISIACLLDEPTKVTVKDLKHLQNQITVLENFLDPFIIEELEVIKMKKLDEFCKKYNIKNLKNAIKALEDAEFLKNAGLKQIESESLHAEAVWIERMRWKFYGR